MLAALGVPVTELPAHTPNDGAVVACLASTPVDTWLVVSGAILRDGILGTGRSFINCHKGFLPDVKGLSATHWAVLTGRTYGASAHWIDRGIDTGTIIVRREYPIPSVDNLRELRLAEAFMIGDIAWRAVCSLSEGAQTMPNEGGEYFHVMHPALLEISTAIQTRRVRRPGRSG